MVAQPDSIHRLTHLRVLAGFMTPPTGQQPRRCNRLDWLTWQRSLWPECEPARRLPRGRALAPRCSTPST